jgi:hypothetical protein
MPHPEISEELQQAAETTSATQGAIVAVLTKRQLATQAAAEEFCGTQSRLAQLARLSDSPRGAPAAPTRFVVP